MLKRAYLITAATILLSGPVMAADIVPEEPVPTWTGFYLGAGGGIAWLDIKADGKVCDTVTDECFRPEGVGGLFNNLDNDVAWRGVIQTGFDWEVSPGIVMGVMGDFNFGQELGIERDTRFEGVGGERLRNSFEYSIDNMWTLAGRLGWANEHALFYGLFGWTWADTDLQFRRGCVEGECQANLDGGDWLDGWTVGGGVEFKGFLFEGASTRLEYRYTDLGDNSANGSDEFDLDRRFDVSSDQNVQGVYLTFNWRFDPF